MNSSQRRACAKIQRLSSPDAAEWLLKHYNRETGNAWDACIILPHRSWKKSDQIKLAQYYLAHQPHASAQMYLAFLRFMALPTFIEVLQDHLPDDVRHRELMKYHLQPILNSHPQRDKYKIKVEALLSALE